MTERREARAAPPCRRRVVAPGTVSVEARGRVGDTTRVRRGTLRAGTCRLPAGRPPAGREVPTGRSGIVAAASAAQNLGRFASGRRRVASESCGRGRIHNIYVYAPVYSGLNYISTCTLRFMSPTFRTPSCATASRGAHWHSDSESGDCDPSTCETGHGPS